MIILICFIWGSFVCAIASRVVHYINWINQHHSVSASSYLRIQRYFFRYFFCDRSKCDDCGVTISWYQNIPLFSYLLQKGKCHSCKKSIPIEIFLFEIFFILLGFILYFWIDSFFKQMYLLLAWSLLVIIAYTDFKTHLIPNFFSYGLLWLGMLFPIIFHQGSLESSILGTIIAYGLLKSLQIVYLYGLKRVALGDADPLLAGALGAWINPFYLPYYFLGATFIMFVLIVFSKRNQSVWQTQFPFGVGLALAGGIVILMDHSHYFSK